MKKISIILALFTSTILVGVAIASTTINIKFPVVELENCKDAKDCHVYCEKPENILKCVDFGQKNGLISAEEAIKTHKFSDVLKAGGPGKCTNQRTCEQYCDATSHINECLTFAEKHELIPLLQLKEAKTVAKVLQDIGKLPGGCKDQKTCEEYCSIKTNYSECAEFGKKVGLISEVAFAQMEEALKQVPPEVQSCFKSVMSIIIEKNKSGVLEVQDDFMQKAFQNCIPKGTSSNPTPNMEEMLKINQLKKLQEQEQFNNSTSTEIPGGTRGGNGMGM